jgi:thermosome
MTKDLQPVFILPEGSTRTQGKNAQKANIAAAKEVADTVRTTLGPKGMDKMIVDSIGDITVTNDGVTILEEMNIEHPSAKMIVEVAKTQENEVGDGTTTAVVIAGELLKSAEDLLDKDVHPTVLAKGFRIAAEQAQLILNNMAQPVTEKDTDILKKIAMTAMTGKGAETAKEQLAAITVDAVKAVAEKTTDSISIDKEDVRVEKKVGGSVFDTELVQGIVLDKERVHPQMERQVNNAKIALVDAAVEIKSPETDTKVQISDPTQLNNFIEQEEKMLHDMVNKIKSSGATVLVCQKGIDDVAQHYLAKENIYAVRRVKKSDMEALQRATGANIVSNIKDLTSNDLGQAGLVEEVKIGDEEMTYVRKCKNPKAVTILIKGGTDHVVDEIKRAMEDAIGDVISALKVGKVVAGAGATEVELARELLKFSDKLEGREQLAVKAFAEAMEIIPRTLAENAGLDPIDILTALKSAHEKKQTGAGINVFSGKVVDAWKEGVIEPLKIKTQAISSAAEVAEMILRIDDVIAGSGSSNSEPPMPPPGMGGMPPGMGM